MFGLGSAEIEDIRQSKKHGGVMMGSVMRLTLCLASARAGHGVVVLVLRLA